MKTEYSFVSPSLEGVLSRDYMQYEGIRRPVEVLRALDGPAADPRGAKQPHHDKLLERYFYDLYGVFMKKLSSFVLDSVASETDEVGLQAMLQEMIKVKKLMGRR